MKNILNVSECFYSIQGEGLTMGIPAVFLRLGGCNLLCKGKGWTCDSIAVWSKSKATIFEEVIPSEWIERLAAGAHLVITGGEPLLQQQRINAYLIFFMENYGFLPVIEIETNGTIMPNPDLIACVKYWNCSPKLSNSGESYERRVNELALNHIAKFPGCFKFVISDTADTLEVLNDFNFLDPKKFIFMPAGDTQELLSFTRPVVAQLCVNLGIRYCDRLHIAIWNQKTGV